MCGYLIFLMKVEIKNQNLIFLWKTLFFVSYNSINLVVLELIYFLITFTFYISTFSGKIDDDIYLFNVKTKESSKQFYLLNSPQKFLV